MDTMTSDKVVSQVQRFSKKLHPRKRNNLKQEDNSRSTLEDLCLCVWIPIGAARLASITDRPRKTSEIRPNVQATISNSSVPGQNTVIIRPRNSGVVTNSRVISKLDRLQGDEEIVEEEAVCKFCFKALKEENALQTKCRCKNALIHEACSITWSRVNGNNSNCDVCGQEIQNFPVTILPGLSSSTQRVNREEGSYRQRWVSRLRRAWHRVF